MKKLTTHCCLWTCLTTLAIAGAPSRTNAAERIGDNFDTAKTIKLDQIYEGTLPISQGRQCLRVDVPGGKRVSIRGNNSYETVFFSAYSNRGSILIGETQVLASFQPSGVVETEENDGTVMVCIDSDTAQRRADHRYSLQVSLLGANPDVVASTSKAEADQKTNFPQAKARKVEQEKERTSPFADSPLQLAANSRSFPLGRDGGVTGDAGNNATTARPVALDRMYSGFLNASRTDDRDCYIYPDLPRGSKLQVSVANNDGILGMSAYSQAGKILIGQVYMIDQETRLETEATSGNVMVCMDTDGEKSDHQYTFQASLKR
jgi:hypothetical protein